MLQVFWKLFVQQFFIMGECLNIYMDVGYITLIITYAYIHMYRLDLITFQELADQTSLKLVCNVLSYNY